jgi:hypothetical protein
MPGSMFRLYNLYKKKNKAEPGKKGWREYRARGESPRLLG